MSENIIIENIERLDQDLIDQYKELSTCDIDDCMGKNAAFSSDYMRFGHGKLCGSALTVKLEKGDNLVLVHALNIAKSGDVIVIDEDNEFNHSIVGDLIATYCAGKGIQGIILNGSVRDIDTLNSMDNFVVYGKAISPNGPTKNKPGSINIPITIDGKVINPGDLIIGDDDGIISIPKEKVSETLVKAQAMLARENTLIDKASHGISPWPITIEDLKNVGCEVKEENK